MEQPSWTQMRRMVLLTFSLIGLQFTWGVEMTYFTPYLLELGLAKSQTALVWLAPPLSGMIVQPLVGTISDSSTSTWGRRRPYMFIGSCMVAVCMLALAWGHDLCVNFIEDEARAKRAATALGVFCIYAMDFALNTVQGTARSLIVDTLPLSQQQAGSAWAGRMLGVGHLLGYTVGTLDLSMFFGDFIGSNQFKRICVIASVTLLACVSLTCFSTKERVLVSQGNNLDEKQGALHGAVQSCKTIFKTALHLPKKIQELCWITFWTWIGWSPFFVYGTTWAGEIYFRQNSKTAQELKDSTDVVGDIARKGSSALAFFAVISLAGSIIWPWLVAIPGGEKSPLQSPSFPRTASRIPILKKLNALGQLDIRTAWALSQLMFAASMILAPFPTSFTFASIIIALCGIPWAMYGWAPLALLGEEITKLEGTGGGMESLPSATSTQQMMHRYDRPTTESEPRLSSDSNAPLTQDVDHNNLQDTNEAEQERTPILTPQISPPGSLVGAEAGAAGVYLGIWNIYATIPQFIATFIAMLAFSILEPGRGLDGPDPDDLVGPGGARRALNGTAACLVVGAVCAAVGSVLTFRLRR